ncbi:hypothetical protein BJ508DRAFT_314541 [Ascobolus immersus RN42]|uniref:Uncharacterized protein n=1 Tax=Ascobolus immersus RN42 TaxID=1160509 RepID=A0A3N4HKJ9_ASCIM|nr:hypothetical protein BJ508DRAFT_314541 [Ascobolus immersus RN42]
MDWSGTCKTFCQACGICKGSASSSSAGSSHPVRVSEQGQQRTSADIPLTASRPGRAHDRSQIVGQGSVPPGGLPQAASAASVPKGTADNTSGGRSMQSEAPSTGSQHWGFEPPTPPRSNNPVSSSVSDLASRSQQSSVNDRCDERGNPFSLGSPVTERLKDARVPSNDQEARRRYHEGEGPAALLPQQGAEQAFSTEKGKGKSDNIPSATTTTPKAKGKVIEHDWSGTDSTSSASGFGGSSTGSEQAPQRGRAPPREESGGSSLAQLDEERRRGNSLSPNRLFGTPLASALVPTENRLLDAKNKEDEERAQEQVGNWKDHRGINPPGARPPTKKAP